MNATEGGFRVCVDVGVSEVENCSSVRVAVPT